MTARDYRADGAQSDPVNRRVHMTVYWTEVNYELSLFATVAEQGADLKDAIVTYEYGLLDADEREMVAALPDDQVADWLSQRDVDSHTLSWGETRMLLPAGWTLTEEAAS